MKTKHTPGPWTAGAKDRPSCDMSVYTRINGVTVSIAYCDLTFSYENCVANARLISASPDMLEALQEIVCAADCNGWDQLDPLLSKARAAIAKATR